MARFNIKVNGEVRIVDADPDTPVLKLVISSWKCKRKGSPIAIPPQPSV